MSGRGTIQAPDCQVCVFFHHTKGTQKLLCPTFSSNREGIWFYTPSVRGSSFAEWQSCCQNLGHLPESCFRVIPQKSRENSGMRGTVGSGASHCTLVCVCFPLGYQAEFLRSGKCKRNTKPLRLLIGWCLCICTVCVVSSDHSGKLKFVLSRVYGLQVHW